MRKTLFLIGFLLTVFCSDDNPTSSNTGTNPNDIIGYWYAAGFAELGSDTTWYPYSKFDEIFHFTDKLVSNYQESEGSDNNFLDGTYIYSLSGINLKLEGASHQYQLFFEGEYLVLKANYSYDNKWNEQYYLRKYTETFPPSHWL